MIESSDGDRGPWVSTLSSNPRAETWTRRMFPGLSVRTRFCVPRRDGTRTRLPGCETLDLVPFDDRSAMRVQLSRQNRSNSVACRGEIPRLS